MNIFFHELKAYRKSSIIWALTLSALAILYLIIFPSFMKDVNTVKKMLLGYPLPVRNALGLSIESFTTLIGFYSFVFGYIILCGAIQAMNIGTGILSKEVRDKTADFLLTKPVKRSTILTAKVVAAAASLLITNLYYIVIVLICALIIEPNTLSIKLFLLISFSLYLIQLMFMSLGIVISVIVPKIKSVLSISLSTVFSFFILSMFGSVIGEANIRYLTPFKYYDTAYIMKNGSYDVSFIIIEIAFIFIVLSASYIIYNKKDIHAV
ncbi:MAG TPA: ABC transporter permease subunit [Clostridiaceae bacterium]